MYNPSGPFQVQHHIHLKAKVAGKMEGGVSIMLQVKTQVWTNPLACPWMLQLLHQPDISQEIGSQLIGYLPRAWKCGSSWHDSGIKPQGKACKVSWDTGQFWVTAVLTYSQIILKQLVWSPYNRSGPYKELFFWKHHRKLPVWLFSLAFLPCRELSLQALGYSVCPGLLTTSSGKKHASSGTREADIWKNTELGSEEHRNDGTN